MIPFDQKLYVAKIKPNGTYEEIPTEEILEEFKFTNILIFFFIQEKQVHVWIGKTVGPGLKRFIPKIKNKILKDHPRLRVLRSFTVDQGDEPWKFLNQLGYEKDTLEERERHQDEQESLIKSEINELQIMRDDLFEKEKFLEAAEKAKQIREKASELKEDFVKKRINDEQQEFINNMQTLNKSKEELREEVMEKLTKVEHLLEEDDIFQAHSLATQIKELFKKGLHEDPDEKSKEILAKEQEAHSIFREEQKQIREKIREIGPNFHQAMENEDLDSARTYIEEINSLLKDSFDYSLEEKWNRYENRLIEKEKKLKKKGKEEEEEQKEQEIIDLNIQLARLGNQIDEKIKKEDFEQIEGLLEQYKSNIFDKRLAEDLEDNKQSLLDFQQKIQSKKEERKKRKKEKQEQKKELLLQLDITASNAEEMIREQRLEEAESLLQSYKEDMQDEILVSELEQNKIKLKKLKNELEEKRKELQEKRELERKQKEQERQKEIKNLTNQLKETKNKIEDMIEQENLEGISTLLEKYERIIQDERLSENLEKNKTSLVELKEKVEEKNKEIKRREQERKRLLKEERERERYGLELRLAELSAEIEQMTENGKLDGINTRLEEYKEIMSNEILSDDLGKNEQRLEEFKEKIKQKILEIEELKKENEREIQDLNKTLGDLGNQIDQRIKDKNLDEIQSLMDKYKEIIHDDRLSNNLKENSYYFKEFKKRIGSTKEEIEKRKMIEEEEKRKRELEKSRKIIENLGRESYLAIVDEEFQTAEEKIDEYQIALQNPTLGKHRESYQERFAELIKELEQKKTEVKKREEREKRAKEEREKRKKQKQKFKKQLEKLSIEVVECIEEEDVQGANRCIEQFKQKIKGPITEESREELEENIHEWTYQVKEIKRQTQEVFDKFDSLIQQNRENKDWEEMKKNSKLALDQSHVHNKEEKSHKYQEFIQIAQSKIEEQEKLKQKERETRKQKEIEDKRQRIKEKLSHKEREFNESLNQGNLEKAQNYLKEYKAIVKDIPTEIDQTAFIQKERGLEKLENEEIQRRNAQIERFKNLISENETKEQWRVMIQNCKKILDLIEKYKKTKALTQKYEEKLSLAQRKLTEEEEIKQKNLEKLREDSREIEQYMEIEEDVMPEMESFLMSDILADTNQETDQILLKLDGLLEQTRVEIKKEAKSKSQLTSKSGETIEIEQINKIETDYPKRSGKKGESQKEEDKEPEPLQITLNSGFDNPFDDEIEEAIIEDVIPYNYEVTEMYIDGENPKQQPEKRVGKDGLEVKWKLHNIPPKERRDLTYELRNRVSRTTIVPLKKEVKVIKNHSNLEPLDLEGIYDANLIFQNNFNYRIENLVIEDIIPVFYLYTIFKPKDLEHGDMQGEDKQLVKWNIPELFEEKKLLHDYRLMELMKFEDIKQKIFNLDRKGFEYLKNKEIHPSMEKYKEILKILKDYTDMEE